MTSVSFHGHACFLLKEEEGQTLVLDPVPDKGFLGITELAPLRVDARWVLSSHLHTDHAAHHLLPHATPIVREGAYGPWEVEKVSAFHDEHGGRLRGGPTDILRIRSAAMCVVHCGDLGELPGPDLMSWLSRHPIDLLLVPAGGWFTLDAADAASLTQRLRPRAAAAYHCSDQGLPLPQLASRLEYLGLFGTHHRRLAFESDSRAAPHPVDSPLILDLRPNLRSADPD